MGLWVSFSCDTSLQSRLEREVKSYYEAWKLTDYRSMYDYLNEWGQEQISQETFVRFMTSVDSKKALFELKDPEADFLREMKRGGVEVFQIEEVNVEQGRGQIRVFLKTPKDLIGEPTDDPNIWVFENGEWEIEVTELSSLYTNIQRWEGNWVGIPKSKPRIEFNPTAKPKVTIPKPQAIRPPEPSSQRQEPVKELVSADTESEVALVRRTFKKINQEINRHFKREGVFPESLSDLPSSPEYYDSFYSGKPYRYFTDQISFWIVASHGPDRDEDIQVERFDGFENGYPPASLVYHPSTGEGDLYNFGPK